jgi:hypothetical protein
MVQRRTFVAEDGSVEINGIFDPVIDHDLYANHGELLPSGYNDTYEVYADPSCSEPAVCGPSSCGFATVADGCDERVLSIGPLITDAYWGSDCSEVGGSPCYAASERPEIPYVEQYAGEGRLARVWINHAGMPLAPHDVYFYDTVLETRCFPPSDGGSVTCQISGGLDFMPVYSDPECSVRIGDMWLETCYEPPKVLADYNDNVLMVEPLPAFDGPIYAPDYDLGDPCAELPADTQLYDFEPSEIELAPLIEILG